MAKIKDSLLELVRQLPDECTWDDVMYQIYVRQKIEAGIKDADEGRMVDHDVVFEEFAE
jgi:predicted transcriptional regulator